MGDSKKQLIDPEYMPPLDGIRGFACILVVITHAMEIAKLPIDNINILGALGVMIFFSLSGFLMGALYFDKSFDEGNAIKYAGSRFSRIFPGYYIAITLYIVSYVLVPVGNFEVTPVEIARLYLFISSASVYWSIPPEVQFYGLFLVIWYAGHLAKAGRYWLVYALGAIVVASFLTCQFWPGILLPSKLHVFVLGFLASLLLKHDLGKRIACHPFFQLGIMIAIVMYALFVLDPQGTYNDLIIAILVAAGVLSLSQATFVTSIFTTRIFMFLGATSFSVYLLHGIVLRLSNELLFTFEGAGWPLLVLVMLASILLPCVFHTYIEHPLNNSLKKSFPKYYQSVRQFYTSALAGRKK